MHINILVYSKELHSPWHFSAAGLRVPVFQQIRSPCRMWPGSVRTIVQHVAFCWKHIWREARCPVSRSALFQCDCKKESNAIQFSSLLTCTYAWVGSSLVSNKELNFKLSSPDPRDVRVTSKPVETPGFTSSKSLKDSTFSWKRSKVFLLLLLFWMYMMQFPISCFAAQVLKTFFFLWNTYFIALLSL